MGTAMRVDQQRFSANLLLLRVMVALSASMIVPMACAEAPSQSKTPAVSHRIKHEHNHASPRYYWASEKLGRIRSFEVEDDVVYVMIFEHHGPRSYWLTGAELRDGLEKARGYQDAAHQWINLVQHGIDTQQAWAVKTLQENFGFLFTEPAEWLQWYDENGDFLRWDDDHGKYVVEQERKTKHLAEAVRGLRFSLHTDKTRYGAGEPIWITVRLEYVYPMSGAMDSRLWVKGRLLWDTDVQVELRTHELDDVGYHHHRDTAPAPSLAREDFQLLDGGDAVEKSFELTAALVELSLKPRHYSIKATYKNEERGVRFGLPPTAQSEVLPQRGPAWTGYLETLTEFFEVTGPEGK
jgi:hypothetical protein